MATRLIDHSKLCDVLVPPALGAGLCLSLRGIFRRAGRARVRHKAIPGIIVPLVASSSTSARRVSAVHAIIFAVHSPIGIHCVDRLLAATRARRVLAFIASPLRNVPALTLQPILYGQRGKFDSRLLCLASETREYRVPPPPAATLSLAVHRRHLASSSCLLSRHCVTWTGS